MTLPTITCVTATVHWGNSSMALAFSKYPLILSVSFSFFSHFFGAYAYHTIQKNRITVAHLLTGSILSTALFFASSAFLIGRLSSLDKASSLPKDKRMQLFFKRTVICTFISSLLTSLLAIQALNISNLARKHHLLNQSYSLCF